GDRGLRVERDLARGSGEPQPGVPFDLDGLRGVRGEEEEEQVGQDVHQRRQVHGDGGVRPFSTAAEGALPAAEDHFPPAALGATTTVGNSGTRRSMPPTLTFVSREASMTLIIVSYLVPGSAERIIVSERGYCSLMATRWLANAGRSSPFGPA